MNKGILIAGNLIVDQIKYVDSYPAPQTLTTISGMQPALGGLACNCALDLAKLDPALPLKVVGVVGQDDMGDLILNTFAQHPSIDTAGIRRAGGTSYTDVMTTPDGGRTFFQYRGANALLSAQDFDFSALKADILHIGYILLLDALDAPDPEHPTAMCRVLAEAQKAGIATSIDVVSEEGDRFKQLVAPALAYTDYCVVNEIEAERTTGIPLRDAAGALVEANLEPACRALMDMGVGRWVVIHSQHLSCGLAAGGAFYSEPSWRIPPGFKRSSVGAGDAFASGILYGAYQGWSLAESIHVAGAVAAHSLSGGGASDAILPLEQLLAQMEAFK